jgi:hypothetical protein
MNDDARVILALAAEADDAFIWNRLRVIQADMFGAGPVSIKFAYYGAEDGRQIRPSSQRNGLWTLTIWPR